MLTVNSQGQAPLQEALTKFLGAPVKLFTSKCVTKELREMGEEMIGTEGCEC
jgi:rRNA-processing protein FCF1